MVKLTAANIRTLGPGLWRDEGGERGLHLQIDDRSNGRSWIFRYTSPTHRKTRDMGLGSVSMVAVTESLQEARKRVRLARCLIDEGLDPKDERDRKRASNAAPAKSISFKEARQQYAKAKASAWSKTHAHNWRRSLEIHAKALDKLMCNEITVEHLVQTLQPLWVDKEGNPTNGNGTGPRVRARIEEVLDWARVRGYRLAQAPNPAKWHGNLEHTLSALSEAVEHHASLPFEQVPEFMRKLRGHDAVTARALEFVVLNGNRTSEVREMEWPEIDFGGKLWTLPAAHNKSRRDFEIPLGPRSLEILKERYALRTGKYVFPMQDVEEHKLMAADWATRTVGNTLCISLDLAVPHGFRSSLRDWLAEVAHAPENIAEAIINHAIGDALVTAYHRRTFLQQRRRYLEMWDDFCAGRSQPAEVITLHGAAR